MLKIMPFYCNLFMWHPRAGNPGTCSHCDCQTQTLSLRNSYDDNVCQHLVFGDGIFPVAIFVTVRPLLSKQRYNVNHKKTFQNTRFGSDWWKLITCLLDL